jgi:hypothetical protein
VEDKYIMKDVLGTWVSSIFLEMILFRQIQKLSSSKWKQYKFNQQAYCGILMVALILNWIVWKMNKKNSLHN